MNGVKKNCEKRTYVTFDVSVLEFDGFEMICHENQVSKSFRIMIHLI